MRFPSVFTRRRPRSRPDPMNPRRVVVSWDEVDELALSGFLDSPASSEVPDASRAEVVSTATLYLDDTGADVRRGDRVTDGDRVWVVAGFPALPVNPFTGWAPYKVVELREVVG